MHAGAAQESNAVRNNFKSVKKTFYSLFFYSCLQNVCCKSQRFLCLFSSQKLQAICQSNQILFTFQFKVSNQVYQCRKNYQESCKFVSYGMVMFSCFIAICLGLKMDKSPDYTLEHDIECPYLYLSKMFQDAFAFLHTYIHTVHLLILPYMQIYTLWLL